MCSIGDFDHSSEFFDRGQREQTMAQLWLIGDFDEEEIREVQTVTEKEKEDQMVRVWQILKVCGFKSLNMGSLWISGLKCLRFESI